MIVVDQDSTIVVFNHKASQILSLSKEDALNRNFRVINSPIVVKNLSVVSKTGIRTAFDLKLESRIYHCEIEAVNFGGAEAKKSGAALLLLDVTDEYNSAAMKRDFFANASHEKKIWLALRGSVILSLCCGLTAGLSGLLIGYAVSKKRKSKGARFVNGLAFFPYLMPSLALSVTFYLMGLNLNMAGAWLFIAVILGTVKYIPMASRSSLNAMMQLSGEIEEAGVIQHIPWWKRMTRIIFPIQKSAFISGFLLPFISCMPLPGTVDPEVAAKAKLVPTQ